MNVALQKTVFITVIDPNDELGFLKTLYRMRTYPMRPIKIEIGSSNAVF